MKIKNVGSLSEDIVLNDVPFEISFKWKKEKRTIKLKNGEDILKFADIIADALAKHHIPYEKIIDSDLKNK